MVSVYSEVTGKLGQTQQPTVQKSSCIFRSNVEIAAMRQSKKIDSHLLP